MMVTGIPARLAGGGPVRHGAAGTGDMAMPETGGTTHTAGGWVTRRSVLGAGSVLLAASVPAGRGRGATPPPLRVGLTPVFLSNDLGLLARLRAYLEGATGHAVELVARRTYQEITALLVSTRLDAAWICGYPFVQYRERLALVAVPVWRGDTLYQSYLICPKDRGAGALADLEGDIHAFSDPDSNSGCLVTRALLAERGTTPDAFFRRAIFTYGHRNVVRAVAARLAQSGSVDGYVLEVLREAEPDLAARVRVLRRSEWLGVPPVAAPAHLVEDLRVRALRRALLAMDRDPAGRALLALLRLDGFAERAPSLYDPIAEKMALVRSL